MRPQIIEEPAIGRDQPVELRRQLGHRFHVIDPRSFLHAGRRGVHLHAGVGFHAQVARRQKENLSVGARRGSLRRIAHNHQRRARLVPSRQVIEIGVLPVGHKVQHRLFGGKQNRHPALQLRGQRHAPRVIGAGGLLLQGVERRGEQEDRPRPKREPSQGNHAKLFHSAIVAPGSAARKGNRQATLTISCLFRASAMARICGRMAVVTDPAPIVFGQILEMQRFP